MVIGTLEYLVARYVHYVITSRLRSLYRLYTSNHSVRWTKCVNCTRNVADVELKWVVRNVLDGWSVEGLGVSYNYHAVQQQRPSILSITCSCINRFYEKLWSPLCCTYTKCRYLLLLLTAAKLPLTSRTSILIHGIRFLSKLHLIIPFVYQTGG